MSLLTPHNGTLCKGKEAYTVSIHLRILSVEVKQGFLVLKKLEQAVASSWKAQIN